MNPKKQKPPELWKSLSNKIRRDLITFIGNHGSVSFTEIQSHFEMKVGTLYHHIDTLGALITQDDKKQYLLTSRGEKAYQLIDEELDSIAKMSSGYGSFRFLHNFFLRPVFKFIEEDSLRSLGLSLFILVGFGVITYFISSSPVLLFPSTMTPNYVAPIIFIISTFLTYLLAELFSFIFFRKTQNKSALFQAVIVAQFPLVLFSILMSLVLDFNYPVSPLDYEIWMFLLLILIQTIYLGLLTESLIVIKDVRMEKAGLISLFVIYILSGLSFLLLRGLEVVV